MKALIIVDVQNDFISGTLLVPAGEKIIPVLNKIHDQFDVVVATQDWHPKNHCSFASTNNAHPFTTRLIDGQMQMMWPDHCVQNTEGAQFHSDLNTKSVKVFRKGTNPDFDSYSGFKNGDDKSTGLDIFIHDIGRPDLYVGGLALDYCVKHTILDALEYGFKVWLILDAVRGIDSKKCLETLNELSEKGVEFIHSSNILKD